MRWRQAHLGTKCHEHLVNCMKNVCAKCNHKRGFSAGTWEHDATQERKAHMGEWEHLERVEGAQLHTQMWTQKHMVEMWLHTGLVHQHSVEKKSANRCDILLLKKNLKNPKTKGEEKEVKVEANKEKLPDEKLRPTSKKDQVTFKPLI